MIENSESYDGMVADHDSLRSDAKRTSIFLFGLSLRMKYSFDDPSMTTNSGGAIQHPRHGIAEKAISRM
ncbi:hypothetical protein VDG1235_3840 [Verrucomicrobiia bacterium DG1235]|nr:hypothetical protein VDG1235_3840 [Verrucomicrobiae bacterium DG1235]